MDAGALSSLRVSNRGTTGSTSITIYGAGFAHQSFTAVSSIGTSTCEATDWISHTAMVCNAAEGMRGTRRVALTLGEMVSSATAPLTMDAPILSGIRAVNSASTGSQSLTVFGSGFGRGSPQASLFGSGAQGTHWESSTTVLCRISDGQARTRRIMLSVGQHSGSLTASFSFAGPGCSLVRTVNLPGTGSASITVHGSHFGHAQSTVHISHAGTACEGTTWHSDSSMMGLLSAGVGASRRVSFTVAGSLGTA
eukprot:1776346-Rhodomonas_salina.1